MQTRVWGLYLLAFKCISFFVDNSYWKYCLNCLYLLGSVLLSRDIGSRWTMSRQFLIQQWMVLYKKIFTTYYVLIRAHLSEGLSNNRKIFEIFNNGALLSFEKWQKKSISVYLKCISGESIFWVDFIWKLQNYFKLWGKVKLIYKEKLKNCLPTLSVSSFENKIY